MNIDKNIELEEIESILYNKSTFNHFIMKKRKYSKVNISRYLEVINNYFEYQYRNENSLSKNLFDTINYMNEYFGYNKKYIYEEYLDNTKSAINYCFLKELLSNQKAYSKFIEKLDDKEMINRVMTEMDKMIKYYQKNHIDIPIPYQRRYNNLKKIIEIKNKEFSILEQQKNSYDYIPGYLPTDNVDLKFKKSILKDIDLNEDSLVVAKQIYINLAEKLEYDIDYIYAQRYGKDGEKDNLYNKNISVINENDTSVICKGWAEIYCKLLNELGYTAKVTGGDHKYVIFKYYNMVMEADATMGFIGENGLGINDLTRVKLGMNTVGFNDGECGVKFQELMKNVDAKISINKSNQDQKRQELIEYYKSSTEQEEINIPIDEKIMMVSRLVEKSNLQGAEYTAYLETLWKILLKKDKVEEHSMFMFTPKKYKMGKLFILPSEPPRYFFSIKGQSCREYSKRDIENAIEEGIIFPTHKNVQILGLWEEEKNERIR